MGPRASLDERLGGDRWCDYYGSCRRVPLSAGPARGIRGVWGIGRSHCCTLVIHLTTYTERFIIVLFLLLSTYQIPRYVPNKSFPLSLKQFSYYQLYLPDPGLKNRSFTICRIFTNPYDFRGIHRFRLNFREIPRKRGIFIFPFIIDVARNPG